MTNSHRWLVATVLDIITLEHLRVSKGYWGASLVAQWLRVCLPMQGTRVRALVWEDPNCRRATGPVSHNYWACVSGACAPQQERPRQWEASAPRWRVAPACRNWRKPSHRNEDPTQPKINNKLINKFIKNKQTNKKQTNKQTNKSLCSFLVAYKIKSKIWDPLAGIQFIAHCGHSFIPYTKTSVAKQVWSVGSEGKRLGVNWTNGPVLQDTGGKEKSSGIFNIYCVFLNVQPKGNGEVSYGA